MILNGQMAEWSVFIKVDVLIFTISQFLIESVESRNMVRLEEKLN